ncbi:MAG TPA: extracellular solute-binding protein [Ktedonobacterales bacterium]|nr:extracellular solute-binding protein [Ktedonobacterales bacterium]
MLTTLGGAGIGLIAAACIGAPQATAPATVAAPAPANAGAAGAAPAAKPPIAGSIAYFDTDDDPASSAWHDKFNAAFQAMYSGVQIENTHIPSSDYQTKLTTALATGSHLDMLFWDTTNVPLLYAQGKVLPLNDVMESIYADVGGKDKVSPQALGIYTATNGDIQGIPYYSEPIAWWFRQDLLQQAGLTPPADHWNWDFLRQAVKATHKPPDVYGVGFPTGRNNGTQTIVLAFILNNGGHLVSQDLKSVVFDSPEVREAYQLLKDLAPYLPPGTGSWANPQQIDAITHSTIANGHYFGRVFQNVQQQNPSLIGKLSNTLMPYNKQSTVNLANWGAHCVLKSAANPQGAKELIRFAFKKDQFIGYLASTPGLYAPVVPSYGSDPAYLADPTLKAFDAKMVSNITTGSQNTANIVQEGSGWQVNPKGATISSSLVVVDVLQKILVNNESVESAVTWGAGQIDSIMKG